MTTLTQMTMPIIGYVFGCFSSAIIVAKLFQLPDPRTQGSNNPGTTNILRLGGKFPAIITLLGDVLKGFIPVMIAKMMGVDALLIALTGLFAFLGHCFPVFYGFKGGKGVATAIGVLFGFHLLAGLLFLITWIIISLITRYSSLSALISIALAPFSVFYFTSSTSFALITTLIAAVTYWRHRENIARLRNGTESKIGAKKK